MTTKTKMNQFFTRKNANEGRQFKIALPDGTETGDWLVVRSVDSDAFQIADAKARREFLRIIQEKGADAGEEFLKIEAKTLASLVASWSFEEPCTPENVENFLREAPQISSMVNEIAGKRSLFFKKDLASSTSEPAQSSS